MRANSAALPGNNAAATPSLYETLCQEWLELERTASPRRPGSQSLIGAEQADAKHSSKRKTENVHT